MDLLNLVLYPELVFYNVAYVFLIFIRKFNMMIIVLFESFVKDICFFIQQIICVVKIINIIF